MRIITHKVIVEYSKLHSSVRIALNEWYLKTNKSDWTCFADVKQTFNTADSIGNKRFVFNIKGNDYRLVALILLVPRIVYIRFIGAHAEYSKISDHSKL